ncbi:MAG: hypothetical protein EA360_07160 [Balneolaceae bacterium]|nr:MAG: hypothetical protein EA360_07160 [Balneolaceae bacterium]
MRNLFSEQSEQNVTINQLKEMPLPGKVLMVTPDHFDILYEINPHMAGNIGTVDKERAQKQWEQLAEGFTAAGLEVTTLQGTEGFPDMVFCANQSLPCYDGESCKVIMGKMHAEQRRGEVAQIEGWWNSQDCEVLHLSDAVVTFEGMGDAIWHPGRRLLWGAYGYRTSREAYAEISGLLDVPVALLELTDPRFYHLDTCFCTLNEKSVMIYPGAFSERSLELIDSLFEQVIRLNEHEAADLFAGNATCPDGKHVLIQQGCDVVNEQLRDAGFEVMELDTSEFLKSGGSVFCMKLLYW